MSARRAVRPRPGPPPETRVPPVADFTLSSGVRVLLVERRDLPVLDLQVVVRTGAAADPPDRAGCAFLTAAVLDQGTTSRSAVDIAAEAELIGATLQTRATWDACSASLHVLTPRLEPALDLLADVVLRPAFPAAELERARERRLASILQEQDEPRIVASQLFAATVFGGAHPYGLPTGGTAASIAALGREDLVAFFERSFTPGNTVIVAAGDVDAATLAPLLEERFSAWPAGHTARPPAFDVPVGRRRITVQHRPGAPQSELRVGLAGPDRSTADYFPLLLGNTVLGGAFTSRLNILLRQEKGYTYGAGSSFAFRRAGGPFLASTAVATPATADALNDMARETARMAEEPVPEPELERARSYIMLGLPRSFETTGDIAEQLADIAIHDLGIDYYEHYAARVRAVDAAAVQAACARWLRAAELSMVVVGDADVVLPELERMEPGAVNVRTEG